MEPTGIYTGLIPPDDPNLPDPRKAMLDATPDCVKVLSTDGKVITMNRAGRIALGIPDDSDFGMPWLPLLSETVRSRGMAALQTAAAGQNARFAGMSESADGVVHWDNLLLPIVEPSGEVLSIMCISRDMTEKVLLEKKLEAAIEREKILSREMQHRVKNVFSVVSGLIGIAEKEARAVELPEAATTILREKLDALSRASDAVFAYADVQGADAGDTDLNILVRSVLRPYGDNCSVRGGPLHLRNNSLTLLALFLHELATNAVKYGALSVAAGTVVVDWKAQGAMLELTWMETGGPPVSVEARRYGFGSEMIDRMIRFEKGTIERIWRPDGLFVGLQVPV